ncbi:hypothetical protein ACFVT2_08765 [Streptomyces sp. NPDC058000]|uniref:hypothetical protein n=1 Tax=Streptomyces sp. NPDC058000 TaxID=3346299 RepID=UPI0036ED7E67
MVPALAVALFAAVAVRLHLRHQAKKLQGRPLSPEGVGDAWFTSLGVMTNPAVSLGADCVGVSCPEGWATR